MIPALAPALAWCCDCDHAMPMTVQGTCATCGSESLVRRGSVAADLAARKAVDLAHEAALLEDEARTAILAETRRRPRGVPLPPAETDGVKDRGGTAVRQWRLLLLLQRPVTCAQISERLGIQERLVRRDLAVLQAVGFPIYDEVTTVDDPDDPASVPYRMKVWRLMEGYRVPRALAQGPRPRSVA